jgi:hypothetical protein
MASAAYAWAVLLHLLSVTFLPFSMLAVGHYDVAAVSVDGPRGRAPSGRVGLAILIASAVLSIITSLFAPDYAMLLYLLNLASPLVARAVYQR